MGRLARQVDEAPAAAAGDADRWPPWMAVATATAGCLTFLPVIFWSLEIWLGGVLGGAATGLITLPICVVLGALAARRPAWRADVAPRPGADRALLAGGALAAAALLWAHDEPDALMLLGVVAPPTALVWIWGTFGRGRARALSFPVLFAWFALPWEYFLRRAVDLPLQAWSADIAYGLLHVAGYAVRYWNDFTLYTDRYYLIVNETCSGMNMLVGLGMYTLVFGWAAQPAWKNRLLLVLLVFPVAMLANGVRVAAIFLMGHYAGNELAQGFWHTGSAYVIFLPVFWFLYVVNAALTRRWRAARRAAAAG